LCSETGCAALREAAVILLDLNLPGADGRELLELLRSHDRAVPVIVLPTSSHPEDIEFCYRSGAGGYLVKPLEYDRWQEMISKAAAYWLNMVELPLPPSRS
jgi:CheY-like chemotaxis protein